MRHFTQKEICGLTGLRPRQVQGFVEEGVITPGVAESTAPGGVRKYSSVNLIEFAISAELLNIKIPRETIKKIIKDGEVITCIAASNFDGGATLYVYELNGEIVVRPGIQYDYEPPFFKFMPKDGIFIPEDGSLTEVIIDEITNSLWTLIIRVSKITRKVEKAIDWDEIVNYEA